MATLPLPEVFQRALFSGERIDPLQDRLLDGHGIEVPVIRWGEPRRRFVRISAQVYNGTEDYRALGAALVAESTPPGK